MKSSIDVFKTMGKGVLIAFQPLLIAVTLTSLFNPTFLEHWLPFYLFGGLVVGSVLVAMIMKKTP
jgi:hypothetical protein